jgi:UDP-GlcNAc:undecaprenyl-phosphate GlcNAc-1-phosphate transferase
MLELTFRRRLLEVVLDFFLIGMTYYLAFFTHYGLVMGEAQLDLYLQSLPLALAGAYISFYALGVYRGVWRYVGFDDLVRYFQASLGSVALLAAGVFLLASSGFAPWTEAYSPMLIPLFGVYLFLSLAASRSSFRILDLFSTQRVRENEQRVLIYGAGDAGEMALRWILMNPHLEYRPVGFLDDNPLMRGRRIHGVQVLGDPGELGTFLERLQVQGLILAGEGMGGISGDDLVALCRSHGCWVRRLFLEFEKIE